MGWRKQTLRRTKMYEILLLLGVVAVIVVGSLSVAILFTLAIGWIATTWERIK